MISKQDQRIENGLPFFKDIPYLGALFRYRTHSISRREVLVIMTPHIIRSEADQARVLAEEAGKMVWCVPDIERIHGHGMEVIGPASQGARAVPTNGNGGGYYTPGPAYFGAMGPQPEARANPVGAAPQPGLLSPHAQPYFPNVSGPVAPGMTPPGHAPTPGAPQVPPSPLPAATQPGAGTPGGIPPGPVPPGTPAITPTAMMPGQPAGAVPVTPVGATTTHQPPIAAPAGPMAPLAPMPPVAPAAAPPVAGPKFGVMMPNGQFVPTSAAQPATPAWPDTSARGFVMQPRQPTGNGAPADKTDRRNTEAREGRTSWGAFGR
jgi:hypothetical protein